MPHDGNLARRDPFWADTFGPGVTGLAARYAVFGPTQQRAGWNRGFLTGALGKTESQFRSTWTQLLFTGKAQAPKQFDSEDDLKKFVSSTPGAVGFIDSGKLDGSVKKAD